MKLSILIPAFREERTIQSTLRRVLAVDLTHLAIEKEIIVCDDGSDDHTARAAEDFARANSCVKIVRHTTNRGKGRAIRTALSHATGAYVLIQDADLEYDPDDYPALLAPVLDSAAPVVYGSRFLACAYPARMHPLNYAANRILTVVANLFCDLAITDEATCFKIIRSDLLRSLDLSCEGFEFCPEVTAKLAAAGVAITEVPVRYVARGAAEGKKIGWRDGIVAIKVLFQRRRHLDPDSVARAAAVAVLGDGSRFLREVA